MAWSSILLWAAISHGAIALQFVVDLHVRAAGAGDDGLCPRLAVLGLPLNEGDQGRVVSGLCVGPVRPGHAFFRHGITSGIVCPQKRRLSGAFKIAAVPADGRCYILKAAIIKALHWPVISDIVIPTNQSACLAIKRLQGFRCF